MFPSNISKLIAKNYESKLIIFEKGQQQTFVLTTNERGQKKHAIRYKLMERSGQWENVSEF